MIGKRRIHAGYEDRRFTLWRLCEHHQPQCQEVGEFYARDLKTAMDDYVVDGTYGWEIWSKTYPPGRVWNRHHGIIAGSLPFESYDHMHLSLKELSTSVVLGLSNKGMMLLHKTHKPPHRRSLTSGETLCGLVFDEQDVSDPDRAGNGMCLKCYGPGRDKEKEREKWLS